jgi:V8-like Glu-specific endopeptidase
MTRRDPMLPLTVSTLVLGVFVVLGGCGYDPAELSAEELESLSSPIVNGTPDPGHPAVGMLTSDGYGICTATLIGRHTLLTAAHCVVNEKQAPYTVNTHLGWSRDGGATIIPAASAVFRPGYGSTGSGLNNDVAVVRLVKDVNLTPMRVATSAPAAGEHITLVGYGYTADSAPGTFGTKRKASNQIGKVTATEIVFYGATGSVGNICSGDSGGPAFAQRNGQEVQVGIHSWGEGVCGVAEHDARADVHHGWIKQQAQGDLYQGPPQDKQPPKVQIVNPSPKAQVAPSFKVQVAAQDDVSLKRVELYLDGALRGTLQQMPFTFPLNGLAAGTHTLRAEAVDRAGHRASVLTSVTVAGSGGAAAPSQPTAPSTPTAPAAPAAPSATPDTQFHGACNMAPGSSRAPLLPLLLIGLLALRRRRGRRG